jgi:hypothetical protein
VAQRHRSRIDDTAGVGDTVVGWEGKMMLNGLRASGGRWNPETGRMWEDILTMINIKSKSVLISVWQSQSEESAFQNLTQNKIKIPNR